MTLVQDYGSTSDLTSSTTERRAPQRPSEHLHDTSLGDTILVSFTITGMSCGWCAERIEKAILTLNHNPSEEEEEETDIVVKVEVSFEKRSGSVWLRSSCPQYRSIILNLVKELGYEVSEGPPHTEEDDDRTSEVIHDSFSSEHVVAPDPTTPLQIKKNTKDTPTPDHITVYETRLLIEGMTCGSCAARIERTIFSLNQENAISILTVNVNHVTMMGVVRHIPGSDKTIVRRLIGLVRQLGYRCSLVRTSFPLTDSERVSLQSSCPNATGEEEEEELEDTEKREAVFEASAHDSVEPTAAEVNPNPDQKRENTYALLIEGMSCASCAARIERTIEKEKTKRNKNKSNYAYSISAFSVAFATNSASLKTVANDNNNNTQKDDAQESVVSLIRSLGYGVTCQNRGPPRPGTTPVVSADGAITAEEDAMDMQEKTKNALQREEEIAKQKKLFIASAVLSIPLLAAMLIMAFTDIMMEYPKVGLGIDLIQFFCATPIVFHFGRQFFIGAYTSLRHRAFTMDTLVAIGTGCSYVYSVVILGLSIFTDLHMMSYFDTSGMLMTFMLLGRFLEANAKRQTSGALLQLMNLVPATAQLLSPEDGETILEVPVSRVKVGDKVRVLAGCRIPVDGHVAEGNSDIDEQAVTGESLPRFVGKGAAVVGGTLNLTATLTVEADKVGEDTMLAKVLRIVEEAQSTKPAVQRIADTVAMYFVPFVILSALVTLVVWLILGATNAYPSAWRRKGNHGMETPWAAFAFNFFISTVVAACPCALGLATPTAIMVGTGVGALHGVLVKSGATLETVCKSSCVVLDKTGTITDGKLQCVTHLTAGEQLPATTICQIVAGVEGQSTHPVAKAVYEALLPYHQKDDSVAVDVATAVTHSGLGVEATVRVAAAGTALTNTTAWTSHTVLVGNLALLQRHEVQLPEALLSAVTELQRHGRTTVLAAVDGTGCFLAGLSDEPKPESAAVIKRLRKEGIRVLMVTGDHLGVATRVAAEVGIPPEDVHAEALPTTKAEIVKQLQQEERCRVMFVGDGINDSPALAQADVGVALGAGTEIAIEAADAVLVRNSLCDLLTLRALSRTTVRRIYGNFVWAFGYNILMIPIASGALYPVLLFQLPPVVAGAAMVVSSLCVLFSSISIRCFRPVRVEDL